MSEMSSQKIFDVLGIPIAATHLKQAADVISKWQEHPAPRYVGCRDVASLMAMVDDPDLLKIAKGAAMNVPDGAPIALVGRIKGYDVTRTCGPDLMEKLLVDPSYHHIKHFLFGGKEGIAEILARKFSSLGAQIVGTHCPPFRPLTEEEDAEVIKKIKDSGAHVVWVGISSPKQDIWMSAHVKQLSMTLIGVGAAFDFHAGSVDRAPKWMQKSGLEWSYRLYQEPRRLWRRYLILAPKFIWRVVWHHPKKSAHG